MFDYTPDMSLTTQLYEPETFEKTKHALHFRKQIFTYKLIRR